MRTGATQELLAHRIKLRADRAHLALAVLRLVGLNLCGSGRGRLRGDARLCGGGTAAPRGLVSPRLRELLRALFGHHDVALLHGGVTADTECIRPALSRRAARAGGIIFLAISERR